MEDDSGLLWGHCGRCTLEGAVWATLVHFGGCAEEGLVRQGSSLFWATLQWVCYAIRLLIGILWSMCWMSGGVDVLWKG